MSQPNTPNQPQKYKSKKAAFQEALLAPPWFPDAKWHARTLAIIYGVLTAAYFTISYFLTKLPKPYQLRRIPMEMTPWLHPGGKVHLSEEELRAPNDPRPPAAPTK
ncbi:MAG: hypothetical protein AAB036_02105 [Elusimicrobiota bacterium]